MVTVGSVAGRKQWVGILACSIALAAFVAQVLNVRWPHAREPYLGTRLARLLASSAVRSVEGRLSGGFRHHPLDTRARGDASSTPDLRLLEAVHDIERDVLAAPTPVNIQARGVAQLLLGKYDDAIASLEAAAEAAARDAWIRNDLAVAYSERARRLSRSEDWPRAMANAERAAQLDPACDECTFNRAAIAETVGLRHEAIRLWDAYLARDTLTAWRNEARQRVDGLRAALAASRAIASRMQTAVDRGDGESLAALVAQSPQRLRELAEDRLLPAWGAAVIAQRPDEARRLLASAQAVGQVIRRYDRSLIDAIDAIARQDAATGTRRDGLDRLARAHAAYGHARRHYEANAIRDSEPLFADAVRLFGESTHPFALWARFHVAIAAYYRGEFAAVSASMATIETMAGTHGYTIVGARAAWMRGLIANLESDFQGSLEHFMRSAAAFDRAGEAYSLAAVNSLLANIYLYIGGKHDVWRLTLAALAGSRDDPSYRRRHTQLVAAAHECQRSGFAEAALVFHDEAVRLDEEWGDPAALGEVHNYRARSLSVLQRPSDAHQAVTLARSHLQRVPDALIRRRLEAEVLQTEVDLLVTTDPKRGIAAADRAIAYFTETKAALRLPRLYLARGRAWDALDAPARALEDFSNAARQFESERATLPRSQELRLSHADELWGTYGHLADASLRSRLPCQDLLAAAERGRAFTLREARGHDGGATAMPTLAADEVILHYTFLPERLLILTLSTRGCEVATVPVTYRRIEQLASAWRTALRDGDRDEAAGRDLFALLLVPAWSRVSAARHLGVVADGPIHDVPFAALPTGDDRRLIDRVDVRLLPTVALRSADSGRAMRSQAAPSPAVRPLAVVATGGTAGTSALPALPFARAEAEAVRQMLRANGVDISSENRTPLLRQLDSATVFHFAGHAVVNPTFPLLSRLEPVTAHDPWITAHDVAATRLRHLRLVVLSACETERGETFGGEGPASLARAFLSAGASQVIATLWPVEDRATSALVKTFYQRWLRHGDGPVALREAMLAGMTADNHDWAAWVAVTSR